MEAYFSTVHLPKFLDSDIKDYLARNRYEWVKIHMTDSETITVYKVFVPGKLTYISCSWWVVAKSITLHVTGIIQCVK